LKKVVLAQYRKTIREKCSRSFSRITKRWETEKENLEKLLKKYDVDVLRPRLLTESEMKDRKEVGDVLVLNKEFFVYPENLAVRSVV
jgi:hypothetical protein